MQLHTADGIRKYLTAGERDAFLRQADLADRPVRTLCMTLAYAGCRLSEALALTADRVDLVAGVLVFESLKKRRTGIFRSVPVPPALLDTLEMVHGVRELQARRGKGRGVRLWPWSRMTGWRAVHAVMQAAGLEGVPASPKGLRHGFGVAAVTAGIPLNLVQRWLGHAQLSTTAVYANARRWRGEGHRTPNVEPNKQAAGSSDLRKQLSPCLRKHFNTEGSPHGRPRPGYHEGRGRENDHFRAPCGRS
jgi:integrase